MDVFKILQLFDWILHKKISVLTQVLQTIVQLWESMTQLAFQNVNESCFVIVIQIPAPPPGSVRRYSSYNRQSFLVNWCWRPELPVVVKWWMFPNFLDASALADMYNVTGFTTLRHEILDSSMTSPPAMPTLIFNTQKGGRAKYQSRGDQTRTI